LSLVLHQGGGELLVFFFPLLCLSHINNIGIMFHQARNIVLALALAAASSRTSSAFTVPSKNHVVFHNKKRACQ